MANRKKHYMQMHKYWNCRALDYTLDQSNSDNIILRLIERKKFHNLLEIGCGPGYSVISLLKKNDLNVTCLDLSTKMIDTARNNFMKAGIKNHIKFIGKNILYTKLDKDHYDLIISRSTLHHLFSKSDIEKACAIIYSSLQSGGTVILKENWSFENPTKFEKESFKLSCKVRKIKCIKELFLTKSEYEDILKKMGFNKIKSLFVFEKINLDKYSLNDNLRKKIKLIKLLYPKSKVRILYMTATK